jgi:hypothetical protein
MALYTVPTGKTTLTESATKSLILINPQTNSIKVRQLDVSLSASAAAEEVQIDLYRVETIGSAAGAATTPQLADERDGAATSSALTILTTEPSAVKVLASYFVQPLGGFISIPFPYGAEVVSKLAGARIGIRYTTAASVKPPCVAQLWFEE